MGMLIVILLAFSSGRTAGSGAECERVDRIELNHVISQSDPSLISLSQVIVWGWNAEYRRYDVRACFLLSSGDLEPYPIPGGKWRYRFRSWGEGFTVETSDYRETRTRTDPEQENRDLLPSDLRIKLRGQLLRMYQPAVSSAEVVSP